MHIVLERPPTPFPSRRLSLPLVGLAVSVLALWRPAPAMAVCTLSACDATPVIAACCAGGTCTIDGTLTVSGPTCTFDFGVGNDLVVTGRIAGRGTTVTVKAKTISLVRGVIDVRGLDGGDGGHLMLLPTATTGTAYSQSGGVESLLDASATTPANNAGSIQINAIGGVAVLTGSMRADGGTAGTGGTLTIDTTGSIQIQGTVSASSGLSAVGVGGRVSLDAGGNLTLSSSGRVIADVGSVDAVVDGLVSLADGSFLQANGPDGAIDVVAGTVQSFGQFRAAGVGGSVDITALTGPMLLRRLSDGITVGPGNDVVLTTEGIGPNGLLTMDTPILAGGADVDLTSAGGIVVSKKIETSGVPEGDASGTGAGTINIAADEDVSVTKSIVASDAFGEGALSIDGRNVTIEGSLLLKGDLATNGGQIQIDATNDIVIQQDITLNVSGSGAGTSGGGSIDLSAGRNITVAASVALIADAAPGQLAGSITLLAGEGFNGDIPGDVLLQGDVKANGTLPTVGNTLLIRGCTVTIPSGAVVDITGGTLSTNRIVARKALAIAGQLKAAAANVLEFPAGGSVSLAGSFMPAPTAGTCMGGTVTANGCQRPVCTGVGLPAGCLVPCPTCGDGVTTFPETCDGGVGGPFCNGLAFCTTLCRTVSCASMNPCRTGACAAPTGCSSTPKADATPCDTDQNVCSGVGTCNAGTCIPSAGTALQCDDNNPCTGPDNCHPVNGCQYPMLNGPGIPGCDDQNFCTGAEICSNGSCQPGTLPCPSGQMCDPTPPGQCENPASCSSPADCNDGVPCTADLCENQTCSNPQLPAGTDCPDQNLCDGQNKCTAQGQCVTATPPIVCNDSDPCTDDSCDPSAGTCSFDAIPGCCVADGDCNDGSACTINTCVGNTCQIAAASCADSDPCTMDTCDALTGCANTPVPGCEACTGPADCADDGDPCTEVACLNDRCQHLLTATVCDDANPCTVDICTPNQNPLCTHAPRDGCCLATAECVDANVCTTDTCDLDANRCAYKQPDPTCTPCTGSDPFECGPRCANTCVAGRCEQVGPDCTDNNPCTADTCDAATGCSNTTQDGPGMAGCDDGQACNGREICTAGACEHPPFDGCDDDDVCTDDTCNDSTGCDNAAATGCGAISCRVEDIQAILAAASGDAIDVKLRTKLQAKLAKVAPKIDAACTASKCAKGKRGLKSLARSLRAFERSVRRQAGKKVSDTVLAERLATRASEAATAADAARAALEC